MSQIFEATTPHSTTFSAEIASHQPPARLGTRDLLGIALFTAFLLYLSVLQSHRKMLWGDEIMGDLVLNAGSWHDFLLRWRNGIDSSGIWFYLFAKPWEWIFGRSGTSLRLFSATGIATAAGLVWIAARRFYSLPVVAASTATVFLLIASLRWQLSNSRCYGVFMASAALVLYLILRGEDDTQRRPTPGLLLATLVAYDILAGSHILGVLYAGALLAMQLALDARARRLRLPLYLAAIAGIVPVVLFSLPNVRSTTALGKPVFWTVKPYLIDLTLRTDLTDNPLRNFIPVLLAVALIHLRRRPARGPVYWILLGFFVLDLVFFTISRVTTSIYVDRYLLPFALGLVLLCAELLTQIREADAPHPVLRSAAPAFLLVITLLQMEWSQPFPLPIRNYTEPLVAQLPPGLPVVDSDIASFVEIEYYHHGQFGGRPFLFPLDPGVTADPSNTGGVSGFHEMDNFARLGLYMPDLQATETILSGFPDFLVITAEQPTAWMAKRILDTHQYAVRDLGALPGPGTHFLHLWRAHRI